jgi:hypothetical protein
MASFGQNIIVCNENTYIQCPHGSKPAYIILIILMYCLHDMLIGYNVMYNFLIWKHEVIKFGMWLHPHLNIKKSMKFAENAGLLQQEYFFLL